MVSRLWWSVKDRSEDCGGMLGNGNVRRLGGVSGMVPGLWWSVWDGSGGCGGVSGKGQEAVVEFLGCVRMVRWSVRKGL